MVAPVERLPIWQTLKEALLLPIHHWQYVGSLMIGPIVLMTVCQVPVLWMDSQEPTSKVTNLLSFLVKALVATILAIAWRRFILLGDKSVSPCRRWTWSMRETKFLLWGIAIGIISLLVVFMVTILLEFLSDLFKDASRWFSNPLAFILSFIAILLLVGYVCGRLSLILPANAIDRRPSQLWMNWAWEQ